MIKAIIRDRIIIRLPSYSCPCSFIHWRCASCPPRPFSSVTAHSSPQIRLRRISSEL